MRYLSPLRAGGIRWIREDFTWSEVQPTPGPFRWTRTDALMRNASLLGINVLAIATYAPAWASGHAESNKYPPVRASDYSKFVSAVAQRYGARGTFWRQHPRLRPSPITAIELWNEPWLTEFWLSGPDPQRYAQMVRAAATAVKRRHPEVTILVSGDVPEESEGVGRDWFRSLLAADPALWRSPLIGAWSVHLYSHDLSPWDTTAPQRARFDRLLLTRSLARAAGAQKPIWITELGWNTDGNSPTAVSEDTQARYIREALVRALTQWSSFVTRSFVFTWALPSSGWGYNLLRPDGSPRPAWTAIRELLAQQR
jgi:polysaccharide biosynthesis protein PslG